MCRTDSVLDRFEKILRPRDGKRIAEFTQFQRQSLTNWVAPRVTLGILALRVLLAYLTYIYLAEEFRGLSLVIGSIPIGAGTMV